MQTIAWAIAQNTLLALVPALLAIIAGYARRPALAHVLWLLVLLKLITPPIWQVPLLPPPVDPASIAAESSLPLPTAPVTLSSVTVIETSELPATFDETPALLQPTETVPAQVSALPFALASAWLCGSMTLAFVSLRRIVRFGRLLRETQPAGVTLERQLADIGRRLQLASPPAVRLGPAGVSPLIWFLGGKPLLLLPSNMMESLTTQQREAILAHELAHLKRRDHWIRLLEMIITLLLWWHPLVWMARQGLRAAEEEACDAWVVWLTRDARDYADALVKLLEMSVAPLPANVSGLGKLGSLKRRLAMIMESTPGKTPRRAGWALVLLGAMVLPLVPVRGQLRSGAPAPSPETPAAVPAVPTAVADETTAAAVKGLLEMAVQSNKQAAEAAIRVGARGGRSGAGGPGGVGGVGGFSGDAAGYAGTYAPRGGGASTALQSIRMMGVKAVPALKESAASTDAAVRALAVQVLAEIHAPDRDSLNTVLKALKDPDKQVRASAATGLGTSRDYRAEANIIATALLPVLEDIDPDVKTAAIRTIVTIGADSKMVTPALTKCLKDEDERVRQLAAEAIGRLNVPPPPQPKPVTPGDEAVKRVKDELDALLPVAQGAEWIEITQVKRGTEDNWEAQGKAGDVDLIQRLIANMTATSKFTGTSGAAPKIAAIAKDDKGMSYWIRFSYSESEKNLGRGGGIGVARPAALPPAIAPTEKIEKDAEVPVVKAVLPNNKSGKLYFYDFQAAVKVAEKDKEKVTQLIAEKEFEIKDQIRTIIASSDPALLSEPGAETIRRQVMHQLEEDLGKGLIKEVLIPTLSGRPYP